MRIVYLLLLQAMALSETSVTHSAPPCYCIEREVTFFFNVARCSYFSLIFCLVVRERCIAMRKLPRADRDGKSDERSLMGSATFRDFVKVRGD
jgi:hypothetical protein